MAFKINKYNRISDAETFHGEWVIGLTDNYIKETAHEQFNVDLDEEQCLEVAEWIEDNLFDIIIQACEELNFEEEDDE